MLSQVIPGVAIGVLTRADMPVIARMGILAAYMLVMAIPALALLGVSRIGAAWVDRLLDRTGGWSQNNAEDMIGWAPGIAGFFLATNATGSLS